MVDSDRIEDFFRNLDIYVEQLRQLARLSGEQLAEDLLKLGAAKYYLQVAVECCIDIANHIIAREGWRAPRSYADAFAVLAEQGLIDQDFAAKAPAMVGMRNRLVHLYWEVDASILHNTLQQDLGDFDRFRALVYRYMIEQRNEPQAGQDSD